MDNKLNNVPYNTGKIKIGVHYQPPQKDYTSPESEHWQNVLTGVYQKRRIHKMQFIWYVVALVIIFTALGVWA